MAIDTQEILKGVNEKDLKAWKKLYESYYAALCAYANHILKDPDTAQDVVQDTLIKIWNTDRTFPDIREFTWYLYRAVYNNSLFYLRKKNVQEAACRSLEIDDCEMPDDQFARTVEEELIRQIYVYIEELPEERKKIILLSLKGHSGKEIAGILGISINTVKTQKNRCFKYLRDKLKDSVLLFLI